MEYLARDDQEYSVNIESIDEQHKELIGDLNKLHDALDDEKEDATISPNTWNTGVAVTSL